MERNTILPTDWDLPQIFRDRVGYHIGRQRAMFADGHLLLLLHKPPDTMGARSGRVFWRNPEGQWRSSMGDGIEALRRHMQEFDHLVDKLDEQQEKARSVEDYFAVLQQEVTLKHTTRNLHITLQQAREMIAKDKNIINLRDRAGELEHTVEILCNDARNDLDFTMAQRAEQQAESSMRMARSAHRLDMLAAFFFPILALGTIFGMNLRHGWETTGVPWPFLLVLIAGILAGYLLLRGILSKELTDMNNHIKTGTAKDYKIAQREQKQIERKIGKRLHSPEK